MAFKVCAVLAAHFATAVQADDSFQPVDGGWNRACRGSDEEDNKESYYTEIDTKSFDACKAKCEETHGCMGIEFNLQKGRCEVWTKTIQATKSVNGFRCLRLADPQAPPAPPTPPPPPPPPPPAVCGRSAELPVEGSVRKRDHSWELKMNSGCSMALRETKQLLHCLRDSWLVLSGTSQGTLMITALVNLLVSEGLRVGLQDGRDGYASDGIYTEVIDVIITNGSVAYKKIWREHKIEYNYHSVKHDKVLQNRSFSVIHEAPDPEPGSVRITLLLAEYWDEVNRAVRTLESVTGPWRQAKVFYIVNVAQWYSDASWCNAKWCGTRLAVLGKPKSQIAWQFKTGLKKAMEVMKPFCSPGGMAGHHGCTLMGLNSCGKRYPSKPLDVVFKSVVSPEATPHLRMFDLFTLGQAIPDTCVQGHSTPAGAIMIWQVLMSSVCNATDAANGSVAHFEGSTCFDWQIHQQCHFRSCRGYSYSWDYGLSKPCHFSVLPSPEQQSKRVVVLADEDDESRLGEFLQEVRSQSHATSLLGLGLCAALSVAALAWSRRGRGRVPLTEELGQE